METNVSVPENIETSEETPSTIVPVNISGVELTHPFKNRCWSSDLGYLLDNCYHLKTYCDRLDTLAALHKDDYPDTVYKGDGFEFLMEAILKLTGRAATVGIGGYEVVPLKEDFGVDGIGIGVNGN